MEKLNPFERINQEFAFGALLLKTRNTINKKSRKKIIEELMSLDFKVGENTITSWENGNFFPPEDKLSEIAKVYGIEFRELTEQYNLSKKAREDRKVKPKNSKEKTVEKLFSGGISEPEIIEKLNPDTHKRQYGHQ
ncbi:MAG: helix-turn-helix transcriptional regulator [Candidatus Pacebacteria bacterium]|nr:helix-turn-helix transcriptional regulator [Candidatus Paceibacterota bacterium]